MNNKPLRILIAPLDWGLGHLTRSVPLMEYLVSLGCHVVFAGNESQRKYIAQILPKVALIHLDGYQVQYARTKFGFMPRLFAQMPRVFRCIKNEHQWLKNVVVEHRIDGIISDNRYGLYHTTVPSVILTHQLQILSGVHAKIDAVLRKIHYRLIERFTACWVVDIAEGDGLSGKLSHPKILPKVPTQYLGFLSQLHPFNHKNSSKDFVVLVLLSGAEPQRSILENLLWQKAIKSNLHIVFVAGSNKAQAPSQIPAHISYHKRLVGKDLQAAFKAASVVVCRSGYSSLMDLLAMRKKAILIPTPGQTEQEYLAKLMQQKGYFMAAQQHKFDIQTSVLNAQLFPFSIPENEDFFEQYKSVLTNWLISLKESRN